MDDSPTTYQLLRDLMGKVDGLDARNTHQHEAILDKIEQSDKRLIRLETCVDSLASEQQQQARRLAHLSSRVEQHEKVMEGQSAQYRLVKWLIGVLIAIAGAIGLSRFTGH